MNSTTLVQELSRAVARLTAALQTPADTDLLKAGCIQYFEFTFELAWKSIKALAEETGVQDCNSPKAALKHAFTCGWATDETVWLDMLAARNRMSHTYDAEQALAVYRELARFLPALQALTARLAAESGR